MKTCEEVSVCVHLELATSPRFTVNVVGNHPLIKDDSKYGTWKTRVHHTIWLEEKGAHFRTLHLLDGFPFPPFPFFTHISLMATISDQMLAQLAISTGDGLYIGVFFVMSALH